MHRLVPAVAILLAAVAARAEDLTSCEQGSNAHKAGNYDQAIADYDRCLSEGRLAVRTRSNISSGVALPISASASLTAPLPTTTL